MATALELLLPPVVCQPWCVRGDGHLDAHRVADQFCTSHLPGDELVDSSGEEMVQVYALHRPGAAAVVEVWTDGSCHLTPDQARMWADAVRAAADLADLSNT